MPRFIACHTMPGVTRAMLEQAGQAAQNDPDIEGVVSYSNLSKGVVHCVFDAPSQEKLASWFQKMKIPYDRIVQVELEGWRESGANSVSCSPIEALAVPKL